MDSRTQTVDPLRELDLDVPQRHWLDGILVMLGILGRSTESTLLNPKQPPSASPVLQGDRQIRIHYGW